ncbi:MAG: agmatine deiminase family protein [Pseudomonadota bacterium]
MNKTANAELIILSTPKEQDSYYRDVLDDIFNFHVNFAKQIRKQGDQVLIFSNSELYDDYVAELGEDNVVRASMDDIWMRDFSLSNATNPIMFRYTAAGQGRGQKDSDEVQETLATFMEDAGVSFKETDFLNDGGNFVDDYAGNVVVSKKFLRDNNLSEEEGRKAIKNFPGINNVAFIESDEQGGLEHADGVVSFVDTNTLIINSYPEDFQYTQQLKQDLKRGLPGVKIHEIVTPYDDKRIHDARFGSACGLYVNALVTLKHIYFPQFGIKEDQIALEQVKAATSRKVVPVKSSQVCHMGGGVRCMSWQLRGENAKKLINYVRNLD